MFVEADLAWIPTLYVSSRQKRRWNLAWDSFTHYHPKCQYQMASEDRNVARGFYETI